MPIDPDVLAHHIAEHGPYLFHVTDAEHRDAILRDGLRPGSELDRYVRDDFFRTRPGHVYICDRRRGVPVVPAEGQRLTLRVDLRKLDPACFDTDEDVPRHQEIFQANPWFRVPTPRLVELEDGEPAPEQAGRLAAWAESLEEFDKPEFVARSLAAGRVAYRGPIPAEALEAVELPSEVVETFVRRARELLKVDDLGQVPALAFNEIETDRAVAIAQYVLNGGLSALGRSPLSTGTDLSDTMKAYSLKEDLRRVGYDNNRADNWDQRDFAFALADLAEAVYEFDRALGWDPEACVLISERAASCLTHIAATLGHGDACALARAAIPAA